MMTRLIWWPVVTPHIKRLHVFSFTLAITEPSPHRRPITTVTNEGTELDCYQLLSDAIFIMTEMTRSGQLHINELLNNFNPNNATNRAATYRCAVSEHCRNTVVIVVLVVMVRAGRHCTRYRIGREMNRKIKSIEAVKRSSSDGWVYCNTTELELVMMINNDDDDDECIRSKVGVRFEYRTAIE